MKKLILISLIMFSFISIFPFSIDKNWEHSNCKVNSFADKPIEIIITTEENENIEDFSVIFSIIEGKGKMLQDTVYPDKNGIVRNNIKASKKMGNNIAVARIYYKESLVKVLHFSVFGIDWLKIIFGIIGGLGLFLFGLKYMSEGLQKTAGDGLRNIISKLTKNTFFSVLVGLIVTSIIQSSSATTVMAVGLVNAGLMSLAQSIGIIMGANIGTTVTAQLIAFKLEDFALPAVALGVAVILFSRKSKYRFIGETIFGFGLLFVGMNFMSSTVSPLRDAPMIVDFFVRFSVNPLLALFMGMIVTMLIQSSSAMVGLTIVLASQGLIDINGAVPLILGENVGTTMTATLAAISSNTNGKRTALVHFLFNMIGVFYMMLGFYFIKINGIPAYLRIVDFFTPGNNLAGENIPRYLANSHSFFNIFNTIIFIPFVSILRKIVIFIIPEKEKKAEETMQPLYLDRNLLENPLFALQQVKKEMSHMLQTAKLSMKNATDIILDDKEDLIDNVRFLERKTDYLQNQITRYIIDISKENLSDREAKQLPVYIHSINDIERVGDHAINIVEYFYLKKELNLSFSKEAYDEILRMSGNLIKMMELVDENIEKFSNERIGEAFILEEKLNEMEKMFAKNHVKRISTAQCEFGANALFTDILSSYEKSGDHIVNIAQAIYNKFEWS